MDLITYIKNRNATTLAWIAEDPANRGACLIVEDMAFWASQGINTVDQFIRDSLVSEYCDVYEDAHNGFSPASFQVNALNSMTNEQIEKEIQRLIEYSKANAEQEAECLRQWEKEQAEAEAEAEWIQKWEGYYEALEV